MKRREDRGSACLWGLALAGAILAASCGTSRGSIGDPGFPDAVGEVAPDVPADPGTETGPGDAADALPSDTPAVDARPFDALGCPQVAGTAMTLHEKAAKYDLQSRTWHLPAGQDLFYGAMLKDDLKTWDQIEMSDNVGLWTGAYAASQAYRWAATRDPEALENVRQVIRGEHDMMRITGVPGLFTRVYINPALPGFPTAQWLGGAYPDCDLAVHHCKKYVEVTEGDYKGLWFKTDASKDEYSGHVLSMATAWELVDDPEVRGRVRDIVTQVGDHLIQNGLRITDIDGKVTTYGHLNALGFDDFPGFNAILALSWMRLAATVGGGKYKDFYDNCLLQKAGPNPCIAGEEADPQPYTSYLDNVGLNVGCGTNWNNHGMAQMAMWSLLRFEDDPSTAALYRKALREQLWDASDPLPMRAQQNTMWTFFYLANRDPADPWPADEASKAICVMKQYPESTHHHATDTLHTYAEACKDRSGDPMTDVVIPIDQTGMDNFLWFRNPYDMEQEPEDPKTVESTEGYLLAYWVGRYFGFITPDM